MLGQMLFDGEQLPRQAARGLMWLTLARDSATPDEPGSRMVHPGDQQSVRGSPCDGVPDARALGAGPQGLIFRRRRMIAMAHTNHDQP